MGCSPPVTVAQVEQAITAELPIGSDYSQVIQWLNSRKFSRTIEHSKLDKEHQEMAKIPNTSVGFFVTGDIFIVFSFDANGKLVSHTVREVFTGP